MVNRTVGLGFALLLGWTSTVAAQSAPMDLAFAQVSFLVDGQARSAALYVPPDYDESRSWPLIVYLHGGGGKGTDTEGEFAGQQPISQAIRAYAGPFPALVLVPRSPVGKIWAPVPRDPIQSAWRLDRHGIEPASDSEDHVTAAIDATIAQYAVDEDRVTLAGQSMGGEGVMRYGALHSDRVAGIAASSGSAVIVPEDAGRLAQMGVWIFQGETDNISTTELAERMVAEIRSAGGEPRYTEFEGVGHDVWRYAYSPGLVDWLVSQRKGRQD